MTIVTGRAGRASCAAAWLSAAEGDAEEGAGNWQNVLTTHSPQPGAGWQVLTRRGVGVPQAFLYILTCVSQLL